MSVVTEILDRLPNPDGGLRRRFSSGLLFVLIVLIGIYWLPGISSLAQVVDDGIRATNFQWSEFNSSGVIIVLFSIIFVIGNLIEVFAYVFLNRLFFIFGGTIAYRGVVATYNRILGRDRQAFSLSTVERAAYEELPDFVRVGLQNPYKRQFEVAFRYLIHISPDDEKAWLQHLDSRNRNLFSLLSAVFIAMVLVSVLSLTTIKNVDSFILESNEVRICYGKLVEKMLQVNLIDDERASQLQNELTKKNSRVVKNIEQILDESEESGIDNPTDKDEVQNLDATNQFDECHAIRLADRASSLETIVFSIIMFLILLAILAVTYALILRNSITSALEMLQLRKGIVSGNR